MRLMAERLQPGWKVAHKFCHERLTLLLEKTVALISFATGFVHQVRDGAQDQAGDLVTPGNPGDWTGFPIGDGCVVTPDQVGNVCGDDVSIGRDNGSRRHRLRRRSRQPGQVEIDRVMTDGVIGVTHLFDDVVNDGFRNQDHLATLDLTMESATGADIDDPSRAPAENGVLRRPGSSHLAPTAMQENHRVPVDGHCETIAIGRGFNPCLRKMRKKSPPLFAGRDQHTRVNGVGQRGQDTLPRLAR